MSKLKRYTVTLDAYVYARNDREAMVKASGLAEINRDDFDNDAQVLKLEETPFASCTARLVHEGRLTLFENKLIEVPARNVLNIEGEQDYISDTQLKPSDRVIEPLEDLRPK